MVHRTIALAGMLILALAPNTLAQPTPTRFLPGVHAPGRVETMPMLDLEGLQVVRLMTDHEQFYRIVDLDDPQDPDDAHDKFERLLDGYESHCVQVTLTLRITDPTDDHFDYIPPEDEQQDIRDVVRRFIAAYACRISACQLGNEIFGGPGTYRVNGHEPHEWTEEETELVFGWLASLANEINLGASDANCDVLIISPALTPGSVTTGARGAWNVDDYGNQDFCFIPDCNSECLEDAPRATAAIERTMTFANAYCGALDVHLHSECVDYLNDVIDLITNDPCDKLGVELAPNVALTCMEWSAAKGAAWWLQEDNPQTPNLINAEVMFEFLKRKLWCLGECELCDTYGPPSSDEWDTFVGAFNDWLFAETGDNLTSFAVAALEAMEANGFLHACYGGGSQRGVTSDTEQEVRDDCEDPDLLPDHNGDIYIWDVTQLRATRTTLDPNNPEAWSDLIRQAYEYAAPPYMPLPGDGDNDSDIDWDDFVLFAEQLAGPNNEPPDGSCGIFDLDRDIDVDLTDFAMFQAAYGT